MAINRNTSIVKLLLKENHECELCGRTHGLDVHHIIPISCTLGNVDLDQEENLIVLCQRCHARLTSRRLLGLLGIEKAKFETKLWTEFYNSIDGDESAADMCDKTDDVIRKTMDFLHMNTK